MRRSKLRNVFSLLLAAVLILAACETEPEPAPEPEPDPEPEPFAVENPEFPPDPVEEPDEVPEFSWDNATVYFAMIDRFLDTTDEPNAYGRLNPEDLRDGDPEYGLFQGGDLPGLTQRIEEGYFTDLGVDALWISSPLEQIHGWVGGGSGGEFPSYGYHGYWHLDWTEIDRNFGTEEDFAELVETAHEHEIRIVLDVVINHPGYNTVMDQRRFDFGGWTDEPLPEDWIPPEGEDWLAHHDYIDYDGDEEAWDNWWSGDWVRAGIAGYPEPGTDPLTESLEYLPDFITESPEPVDLAPVLQTKREMGKSSVEERPDATVREYLIGWIVDWVREYGIDGFRIDAAKHVELEAWQELKDEATAALREWKEENPEQAIDDKELWMTGEVWGHSPERNEYMEHGFDSLINFQFQRDMQTGVLDDLDELDRLYQDYADVLNADSGYNVLSYLSNHDIRLWAGIVDHDPVDQKRGLTRLFLLPGAIHLFYGDELMREEFEVGTEPEQGVRSPMDWDKMGNDVHEHTQRLGQFRNRNIAVGAGQHQPLESTGGYAFGRDYFGMNSVAAVLEASGEVEVQVGDLFDDGTELYDPYNDATATVEDGAVTFDAGERGLILIEEAEAEDAADDDA